MEKIIELKIDDVTERELSARNKVFFDQYGDNIAAKFNETGVVTLRDIYDFLYGENQWQYEPGWNKFYPVDDYGYTKENPELHLLSFKEKHPHFCPCCGRPW